MRLRLSVPYSIHTASISTYEIAARGNEIGSMGKGVKVTPNVLPGFAAYLSAMAANSLLYSIAWCERHWLNRNYLHLPSCNLFNWARPSGVTKQGQCWIYRTVLQWYGLLVWMSCKLESLVIPTERAQVLESSVWLWDNRVTYWCSRVRWVQTLESFE